MISMPQELLLELDQAAQTQHKGRSELIRELVFQYLRGDQSRSHRDLAVADRVYQELRQYTFSLKGGETAEGLIRKLRETR